MLRLDPNSFRQIGSVGYRDLERDPLRGPRVVFKQIPVLTVQVEGLQGRAAGIVALSDIQGTGGTRNTPRLAAHDAFDALALLAQSGAVPALSDMVAVLPGDYFAHLTLHKRGGAGDVSEVWRDAAGRFGAAVGVLGNHDRIGSNDPESTSGGHVRDLLAEVPSATIVDGDVRDVRGLRIGGVNGTIGDLRRPYRRDEDSFVSAVEAVVLETPDLVVLHQGPAPSLPDRSISAKLRSSCLAFPGLTVFGHDRVPTMLEEPPGGAQFLSVLERIVVMLP